MQNCIYNAKSCKQDQVEEVDEMSDPCRQVSARRLPPLPGNVNKYHNILSNDRHLAAFNYGLRQKSAEMTAVPVPGKKIQDQTSHQNYQSYFVKKCYLRVPSGHCVY